MDNMLDAWRAQYLFDAAVEEANEQPVTDEQLGVTVDAKALAAAVNPFDTDIGIGQIRIMTSEVTTKPEHIPYVAVLCKWTDHSWLVAPFSRFTVPAVRGEMLVDADEPFAAVLQCWNAKIIPTSVLERSWKAGELQEQKRIDGYDLFRHLTTNTPLMTTFSSVVGPELTDPLDIRNNYMAEERDQYRPLDELIRKVVEAA